MNDCSPITGNNYYRLTQFDNDGTATVLGIRVVKFGLYSNDGILVFSNPVVKQISIQVAANIKAAAVTISTVAGTEIYKCNLTAQASQTLVVHLDEKPTPGVCILTVVSNDVNYSTKIKVD